jgi:hypothetical protein
MRNGKPQIAPLGYSSLIGAGHLGMIATSPESPRIPRETTTEVATPVDLAG